MHQANIKRMKLIKDTRLIVGYDRHAIHYNKSVIKKIKLLKKERRKIHSYKLVTASYTRSEQLERNNVIQSIKETSSQSNLKLRIRRILV